MTKLKYFYLVSGKLIPQSDPPTRDYSFGEIGFSSERARDAVCSLLTDAGYATELQPYAGNYSVFAVIDSKLHEAEHPYREALGEAGFSSENCCHIVCTLLAMSGYKTTEIKP